MKKLLIVSLSMGIMAFTPEEIVKKIDVKKEIEDHLEAQGSPLFSPSFYKAYRYVYIYNTCGYLRRALEPYLVEYLKNIKMENDSQPLWYSQIFWYLTNSTHIAIGEMVKKEENIYYDYCTIYCTKLWIRIIEGYKGLFRGERISVWLTTCEGKISHPGIEQWWFIGDTLLLFLQNLPQACDEYARKHGEDINYLPQDFFITGLICGTFGIISIDKEKRIIGCSGQRLNLPYKNVIDLLNTFIPVCEKLERKIKEYKFPLTEKEYAEFMKKRGYNYPLSNEDFERLHKKFEKK